MYMPPAACLLYNFFWLMSPVSRLLSQVSLLKSHFSSLTSPVSLFLSYISCLLSPSSYLLSQISCLMFPVSRIQSHVSCLTSSFLRRLSHVSCLTSPNYMYQQYTRSRCQSFISPRIKVFRNNYSYSLLTESNVQSCRTLILEYVTSPEFFILNNPYFQFSNK